MITAQQKMNNLQSHQGFPCSPQFLRKLMYCQHGVTGVDWFKSSRYSSKEVNGSKMKVNSSLPLLLVFFLICIHCKSIRETICSKIDLHWRIVQDFWGVGNVNLLELGLFFALQDTQQHSIPEAPVSHGHATKNVLTS